PVLNSKMVSEPPSRFAGSSAIRFLIGPSTIYIRAPNPTVLDARGVELDTTLNSKMVSKPPPRSVEPPAIKFLIGSFTIYIRAPSSIELGARRVLKSPTSVARWPEYMFIKYRQCSP
ncbi:hypothetical protein A2U01_0023805, partial [Trifolium medium]|nr:hypothetical protein [Trifolium medium]